MSRFIKLEDALRALTDSCYLDEIDENIQELPSIDIVRCRECKRYEEDSVGWYCDRYKWTMQPDDFCSYAEREGE